MTAFDISYPNSPGFKKRGTSSAAAHEMRASATTLRSKVLQVLTDHGPHTADECADLLGVHFLSVRPRMSELLRKGLVRETGDRRPTFSGKMADVMEINHD